MTVELKPDEVGPVYRNATMYLRPKTGLNDMTIQLDPGTPEPGTDDGGRLGDGDRIGIAQTTTNVNPDEVLAALDADTRRYLAVFANAGGQGLEGRGPDLRGAAQGEPADARADGAREPRARRPAREAAAPDRQPARCCRAPRPAKDGELASLVEASADVLDTVGAREAELAAGVERLPGALGATRRGAASRARALAEELRPAAVELRPLVRELTPGDGGGAAAAARRRADTARGSPPARPRGARRSSPTCARPFATSGPPRVDLVRIGKVLNYVANELGHNPPGDEEGFLFWVAWFIHNASSILTTEDAHGATWRGLVMVSCSSLGQILSTNPALAPLACLRRSARPAAPGRTGEEGLMQKQAPTIGKLAMIAVFALSCFLILTYLWTSFGGPTPISAKGYRFHADFEEATQLADNADVRISGVTVGHVKKSEQVDDVDPRRDRDRRPVRADPEATRRRSCGRRRFSARRTSS